MERRSDVTHSTLLGLHLILNWTNNVDNVDDCTFSNRCAFIADVMGSCTLGRIPACSWNE